MLCCDKCALQSDGVSCKRQSRQLPGEWA